MTPGIADALALAATAFIWVFASAMAFFLLTFIVIFISDEIKRWMEIRKLKEQLKTATRVRSYFDEIEEYRNDFR